MGYSNFKKLRSVTKKFGLDTANINLFKDIVSVEPTNWLKEALQKARIMPLTNEKNKAERLISPILMVIAESYADRITLFSGEELEANAKEDLAGACDFFFALHPPKTYMDAPIISLTESKNEDMEYGRAQCAAQLYGAKLFNEAEGKNISILYGCATDGVEWQFMRFENNIFYVDNKIYTDIKEILGVWHHIIQFYVG